MDVRSLTVTQILRLQLLKQFFLLYLGLLESDGVIWRVTCFIIQQFRKNLLLFHSHSPL